MTTRRVLYLPLLTLLALLVIEFPEPAEDEYVEDKPSENHDKPPMHFAVNGNNGNDEDE
jgi:hypothetical protein